MINAFDWWQREYSTTHQSFFIEGKRENVRFFKNDTPIHSEISSNFTPFRGFSGVFIDSENFLETLISSLLLSKRVSDVISF